MKRVRKIKVDEQLVKNEQVEQVEEKEVKEIEPVEYKEPTYRWKKVGGGALHFKGHIIKPGQILIAKESEIPQAFKNSLLLMDKATGHPMEKVEKVKTNYKLEHRGSGWYDVVDDNGKPINEKAMKQSEAEQLLNNL
jgi:hypothetical protein